MTSIIFGILWIVTIVVVSAFVKFWKAHKDNDAYTAAIAELKDWAAIVVRWAKDAGDQEDMSGDQRRTAAIENLKLIRDKLKLDVTDDQIAMLVRAAYTVMIDEGQEPVYLVETSDAIGPEGTDGE